MNLQAIDHHDAAACYAALMEMLHPDGLACPRCQAREGLTIHRRHRAPVLDYRCSNCGRVFNAWTETILQKTHHGPGTLLRFVQGILARQSTAELARELHCQPSQLQRLRRRLQPVVWEWIKSQQQAESTLS